MSNKKKEENKKMEKIEAWKCAKCGSISDTEREKCTACHEEKETEQQPVEGEQQAIEEEQQSAEEEQQPVEGEQQSAEEEQQSVEGEQQSVEKEQQSTEEEEQSVEGEQNPSVTEQQEDEKKQTTEEKEQPEEDSGEEKPESSILKKALVLGTVALIIFIVVITIVNNRGPGDELYVEVEVEETDEPSEEFIDEEVIDEEVEIPEGVLSNDYVVILQYKGLEFFVMEMPEITEDDVELIIQAELGAQSITEEVTDRAAEDGDTVTIDFAGSVDGEYFDGGTSEGFDLTLGAGTFLGPYGDYEGFEEQIIGHEIGDNFDITVQFPADYFSPDLAGEVANFNITIHAITETITPELTDEWVQENSDEATTVEEHRQMIRDNLYNTTKVNILDMQQQGVFEALMEQVVIIEIPEWAIEEEATKLKTLFRNIAASEGMTLEEYLLAVSAGLDEETFNQEVLRVAEELAPRTLAINLILEYENIETTQEEKTSRMEALALLNGMESVEELIEVLGEGYVNDTLILLSITEFLIEHAAAVN